MLVECCAYFISCLYIHNSDKKSGITNIDYVNKHFGEKTILQFAADNFRKYRSNLYKTRKFKLNKNCKYTILKDYEHEWKLYFHFLDMSPDDKILITFNRLKSLSSNIFRLENYSFTSDYNTDYEKLLTFSQKCKSLQKKIDFNDFLSLYKFILTHIKTDDKYLGINMFRLERMLNPYTLISQTHKLSCCENDIQRQQIFTAYNYFQSVDQYPNLFKYLSSVHVSDALSIYQSFRVIEDNIPAFLIVIDDFVENNVFGEDWEDFFLEYSRSYVKKHYAIDDSLYQTESIEKENFQELLGFPTKILFDQKLILCQNHHHYSKIFELSDEGENFEE